MTGFQKQWFAHAQYWLTAYKNPVHILIYNNVKKNTAKEIEEMQTFLGYKFNGINFRYAVKEMPIYNMFELY